jgi:hypothetical protein
MIAGTLEIQLLANMARLQKDMDDAKRAVGGAMAGIESAVASAKTALIGLGAVGLATSFLAGIRGAIDLADKLNDLSKTTKIAVGDLAGLKLAARQSGGDLEGIAASINKLSVAMGKDPEKFKRLGVDARSPLDAFKQLSDVFSAIEDPQLRAALGAEALGKSWASAAPLLSEGGKKIGEMVEKGKKLSGVTQEMADRADEFNDKMAELQAATDGAKMKLAGELLRAMIEITKAITEAYEQSGKLSAIWVSLGALGAFAFTNEFSSATVKIKDATRELEGFKKLQQDQQGAGFLSKWMYGGMDLDAKIKATQGTIASLQSEIDRPAREAAAKAADKAALAKTAAEAKLAEEKARQFVTKDKTDSTAASETKLYTSALQALEQQLGKANEQTQVQKTQYQLLSGSLQTLSDAHGKHLLQIAKEIDLKAQWAAVTKAALDYAKELTAEQERADAVLANFNTANSEYLQQLEFEVSLIRLTAGARELATAERKLDMDYQRAQIGLNEQELATLTALYQQQKAKLPEAVGSKVSAEAIFAHQEDAKKQLDAFFDPTKAQTFGEALKGAFGGAAESMGKLSSVLQAYGIQQAEIAKARKAADVAYANDSAKLAQAQQAISEKEFATRIGGYADMAGAAKGFFKEGSDGYKTLDGVSQAFHAVQTAMNLIEMGQMAVKAVLNQASGDPYTAFPRMAAMAAAVGALGFAVGGGFNSGGDAASSIDRQKAQGTGTVLGDSSTKSNSLLAALDAMEANTFTQLKYSSGMLDALKSIQRSMAGLAQIVFRTNGLTSGNVFGIKEGTRGLNATTEGPLGAAFGGFLKSTRPDALFPGLGDKLDSLIGSLWGKKTTAITDSGLGINGSLGDLTQGRGFSQYADVQTTSSSFFGLVKKTSTSTQSRALDQAMADQLAGVFAGISDSLQIATTSFGADANVIAQQLASSVISIPAVSLRGLKGQELQDALNAVFSGAADKLAQTVAPGFEALQKTGEGYYETVIRASNALATANGQLDRLRLRLFSVSVAGATAATQLAELFGGINELNAASQAFYEDYFSEAERAAQSTKDMTQALATVNLALPGSKDELRALAGTLDLNTESGRKAYQVLLAIAPEFAATADAAAKFAKDTADKLLATFTGNGQLVPALDDARLNTLRLRDSLTSTYTVAGAVSTLFLDVNSGLITFGSTTSELTDGLNGAQVAGGVLTSQIEQLRQSADAARIDFAGLSDALAGTNTSVFVNVMAQVFENLATRIGGVVDGIASERLALRDAALQIINPGVMSKDAIGRGLAGIGTALPSNAGVLEGQRGLGILDAQVKASQENLNLQKGLLNSYVDQVSTSQQLLAANANRVAFLNDANVRVNADLADLSNNRPSAARDAAIARDYNDLANIAAELNLLANSSANAVGTINAYTAAIGGQQAAVNQAAAVNNQSLADQAWWVNYAKQQQLAYAAALQNFAIDAGKSVTRLGKLREETLKYYEAQKQLADLMGNSAAGLRTTVADYRYSQLTDAQQFDQLQADFAKNYAMGLSTDGATLAGYGDKINSALNPLLEKARAVLSDSAYNAFAATTLARAEAIAGRLETLTPTNYAADSLALLGQIDATLAALDQSSKSAEKIISDAVAAGADKTANGLRAVIAALTGQAIPAFASGGDFAGGLRIVGENGPELEATGPSRIFSASQTRDMMRGGGSNAELISEVRALRLEVTNLRAESRATATSNAAMLRLAQRAETDGTLVRTDADTPLKTVAA